MQVQAYIQNQYEKKESKKRTKDNRSRTNKEKIADYQNQIDKLSSIVAAQNSTIQNLLDEINRVKSGVVLSDAFLKTDRGI